MKWKLLESLEGKGTILVNLLILRLWKFFVAIVESRKRETRKVFAGKILTFLSISHNNYSLYVTSMTLTLTIYHIPCNENYFQCAILRPSF